MQTSARQTAAVRDVEQPGRRGQRAGFTLVELLVTIAVIGILATILLPALGKAKAKGHAVQCLSNQRQLMLACLLYSNDHEDALPYNLGDAETKRTVAEGRYLNWVNNVLSWELDADNTNTTWVREGGLGPYSSGTVDIYRCPRDYALSDLQKSAGWSARVRSVSMNAMIGDAGDFTRGGTNVNVPGYRQFFRLGQIPNPAWIFVFIEEHPDSVNDGYFLNHPRDAEWYDLPASYHDGAANLAFADGHAESHYWLYPSTKPPPRPDAAALPLAIPAGERGDFNWLMAHTSRPQYYFAQGQ